MRLHSLTILIALLLALAGCEDSATPAGEGKDSDDDVEESKGSSNADDEAEDDEEEDDEDDTSSASKDAGSSAPREAGSASSSMRSDASASSGRMDAGKPAETSKSDASTPSSSTDAGTPSGIGYSPCPASGVCTILPLGDSITDGLGVTGGGGYRIELFKKASTDNHQITFVGSLSNGPSMVDGKPFPKAHEGHSGWTISRIAGLVPSPALKTKADIVLLMAGTNDMYTSPGPADAPKRLGDLIDKIAAVDDHMLIVVAQLTPLSTSAAAIKTFNSAIPAVVEERAKAGKHVVLVDMHTGFPTSELADGVHPNQQGYARMAGVWYEAIKGVLR